MVPKNSMIMDTRYIQFNPNTGSINAYIVGVPQSSGGITTSFVGIIETFGVSLLEKIKNTNDVSTIKMNFILDNF